MLGTSLGANVALEAAVARARARARDGDRDAGARPRADRLRDRVHADHDRADRGRAGDEAAGPGRAAVPRGRLPWQVDILLDWIRQDPEPSAAVFQGLFFGRTAPPREERREIADADARDRPPVRHHPPVLRRRHAGRGAAERAAARRPVRCVELRVAPRRLTDEIAAFVDDCWRPRAARARERARPDRASGRYPHRPGCRVARKRRSAAGASAKRRSRPRRPPRRAASACRWCSASCWPCSCSAAARRWPRSGRSTAATSGEPRTRPRAARPSRSAAGGRPQEGRRGRRLQARRRRRTRAPATRRRTSRPPTTSRTRRPPATTSRSGTRTASTTPGDTPELGKLVHTLEHGRIDIQYKKGTPATTIAQLETLYNEMDGGLPPAAVRERHRHAVRGRRDRLGHQLGCPTMNPQVFDAIRAFREEHIDKGPEIVRRPGRSASPAPAAGLASVEAVTGDRHARAEHEDAQVQPQRRVLEVATGRARSARATAATRARSPAPSRSARA